jgi:cytoskeletal protein RodZ
MKFSNRIVSVAIAAVLALGLAACNESSHHAKPARVHHAKQTVTKTQQVQHFSDGRYAYHDSSTDMWWWYFMMSNSSNSSSSPTVSSSASSSSAASSGRLPAGGTWQRGNAPTKEEAEEVEGQEEVAVETTTEGEPLTAEEATANSELATTEAAADAAAAAETTSSTESGTTGDTGGSTGGDSGGGGGGDGGGGGGGGD